MSNDHDGFYLIENHVAYSKRASCLRVIRDGLTWSTLSTDVPRAIELRAGGDLFAAVVFEGTGGAESRGPLEQAGTWATTAAGLELAWRTHRERLVPTRASRLAPEPILKLPRGRIDDALGLVLEDRGGVWGGKVELDGPTELSFVATNDLASACSRAREVVEILRGGALGRVKSGLAAQVFDEYVDYMRGLGRAALPTPEALASSLRVDTIALDEHGEVTLWFGRVLGEHTVLAVLSHDCQSCELGHP